eukprot:TRINITY_DN3016_c0_g1_i1.p1 TRINITY_DN3016_c0_g1~~TRINITY_DN3016_c0_g1_i1.p1  ORF type:complete len:862 (+),score=250.98 TRINITY_DN3016_c0_g1_i1:631-3216(+)
MISPFSKDTTFEMKMQKMEEQVFEITHIIFIEEPTLPKIQAFFQEFQLTFILDDRCRKVSPESLGVSVTKEVLPTQDANLKEIREWLAKPASEPSGLGLLSLTSLWNSTVRTLSEEIYFRPRLYKEEKIDLHRKLVNEKYVMREVPTNEADVNLAPSKDKIEDSQSSKKKSKSKSKSKNDIQNNEDQIEQNDTDVGISGFHNIQLQRQTLFQQLQQQPISYVEFDTHLNVTVMLPISLSEMIPAVKKMRPVTPPIERPSSRSGQRSQQRSRNKKREKSDSSVKKKPAAASSDMFKRCVIIIDESPVANVLETKMIRKFIRINAKVLNVLEEELGNFQGTEHSSKDIVTGFRIHDNYKRLFVFEYVVSSGIPILIDELVTEAKKTLNKPYTGKQSIQHAKLGTANPNLQMKPIELKCLNEDVRFSERLYDVCSLVFPILHLRCHFNQMGKNLPVTVSSDIVLAREAVSSLNFMIVAKSLSDISLQRSWLNAKSLPILSKYLCPIETKLEYVSDYDIDDEYDMESDEDHVEVFDVEEFKTKNKKGHKIDVDNERWIEDKEERDYLRQTRNFVKENKDMVHTNGLTKKQKLLADLPEELLKIAELGSYSGQKNTFTEKYIDFLHEKNQNSSFVTFSEEFPHVFTKNVDSSKENEVLKQQEKGWIWPAPRTKEMDLKQDKLTDNRIEELKQPFIEPNDLNDTLKKKSNFNKNKKDFVSVTKKIDTFSDPSYFKSVHLGENGKPPIKTPREKKYEINLPAIIIPTKHATKNESMLHDKPKIKALIKNGQPLIDDFERNKSLSTSEAWNPLNQNPEQLFAKETNSAFKLNVNTIKSSKSVLDKVTRKTILPVNQQEINDFNKSRFNM